MLDDIEEMFDFIVIWVSCTDGQHWKVIQSNDLYFVT